MYLIDPLKRVALASQYGKQVLQRLRFRPSDAVTVSEPNFDSAPLPEIATAVPAAMPAIYEEQEPLRVYPGALDYEQNGQVAFREISFTPQFRLEPMQPMVADARMEPELTAVAEISQAIDIARHPESIDGILQQPDILDPRQEQGLENLLDDPMLGPLGPLF